MLNLSVFPDLLAIGGLVLVFASLLRRTRQTRLRYWLVGWVMILVHIVAQLLYFNLPALDRVGEAVSLSMLLLTSVAFIWAGHDRRSGWVHGFGWTVLAALPDVAFVVLFAWGVQDRVPFLALTGLAACTAMSLFRSDRRGARPRERWMVGAAVLLAYVGQATLVARAALEPALIWMLCWHYALVAYFFWRGADRATLGVSFTTASFVAWALVFPVADALERWLPGLGIQAEAWNLPKFMVATGMIFTVLEEQLGAAKHAALHDPLTGLPNRRLFTQRLDAALARARQEQGGVALLVIDMDDFKRVNDTRGHAAGDAVLAAAAGRLQSRLRVTDTLARLGGDEFAAILPDPGDAAAVAGQIDRLVRALDGGFEIDGERVVVQASIGAAFFPWDGADEAGLLAAADRAMYARKFDTREQPTG
ncbi:MAG: GGDEF domain-containing protein [Xanthomonadaceae bacterium]|nr:GGDEF domain-containing protein [Xanthomonadaceae bacterium]MDE1965344.1 GGDEF domain-containing protein [Xanthomonadaceae bacterium]